MRITNFLFALALLLSIRGLASVTPKELTEEQVVHDTYGKLAFAVQLANVEALARRNPKISSSDMSSLISQGNIGFEISNFLSGSISEIINRPFSELVSKPQSQVLEIAPNTNKFYDYSKGSEIEEHTARAGWVKGQTISEDWSVPFSKVYASIENAGAYKTYADYTIRVTFKGQTTSYRALALFGRGVNGQLIAHFIDPNTGNSALDFIASHEIYPHVLLKHLAPKSQAIRDWLDSNTSTTCTDTGSLCCIKDSVTCKLPAKDLEMAIPDRNAATPQTKVNAPTPNIVTQECSDYGFDSPILPDNVTDTKLHVTGNHSYAAEVDGSCDYSDDPAGTSACFATATADATVGMSETGITSTFCHVTGFNTSTGFANGLAPTASSIAAGAVRTCFFCSCSTTVSFNGPGGSVSFPPDNIFSHQTTFSQSCPRRSVTSGTPIIIDLDGSGYHLTSAASGVYFDLHGDGTLVHTAWTESGSRNAFLVLDRDGNGKIDSGKELFGDATDQPPSNSRNGFLALAMFDRPEAGGNNDGIIDENDSVWSHLRLWIDSNHDGISQPDELFSLPEMGVYSISLKYTLTRNVDSNGNVFRYKGRVNVGADSRQDQVDRTIYDVVFAVLPK